MSLKSIKFKKKYFDSLVVTLETKHQTANDIKTDLLSSLAHFRIKNIKRITVCILRVL